jgi:hypothetical protein
MSTTSLDEATETAPAALAAPDAPAAAPVDAGVKTFRGRALEELLPQIREQLGPDAIVVRQRDGLMGGVGGFFQQRFVEVDARAGAARIDVYDEQPEAPPAPESFAALLADAEADADPIVTAAAFAPPVLPEPATEGGPRIRPQISGSDPHSSSGPASLDAQTAVAPSLAAELQRAGMSASFAERLLADAEAHELPFAGGDLRAATRRALARRLPAPLPHRAGGLAVAFAGPGSTGCADALARAYTAAGRRAHAVATLEQARTRIERGAPDAVLALDLPPIAAEREGAAALAQRVAALELDELLMVLPAELDLPSARALHERLAPLRPAGVALACDGAAPAGSGPAHPPPAAALEFACATRLPLVYVLDGTAIAPADPVALAARLLP